MAELTMTTNHVNTRFNKRTKEQTLMFNALVSGKCYVLYDYENNSDMDYDEKYNSYTELRIYTTTAIAFDACVNEQLNIPTGLAHSHMIINENLKEDTSEARNAVDTWYHEYKYKKNDPLQIAIYTFPRVANFRKYGPLVKLMFAHRVTQPIQLIKTKKLNSLNKPDIPLKPCCTKWCTLEPMNPIDETPDI
jgi:hypothetical protein